MEMVNNMGRGDNMKIQSRSVLELKSFDNSRLSLGPESAFKKPSNEDISLGDYFSSKKDLKDWKLRNDEMLDNLTPTMPKLRNSITPTKGAKPINKVVKQILNKYPSRKLIDRHEMFANGSFNTLNSPNRNNDLVFIGANKSPTG